MKDVRLTREAENDLHNLFEWYESQQTGLGQEFIRMFDASAAFIAQHPGIGSLSPEQCLRVVTKRFPVNIYYKEALDACYVLAILHQRLDLNANKRSPGR